MRLFATSGTTAYQASLSFTSSRSLLKFISIESVMASSHLILCHPLLLLPSIFPSTWVFSSELAFRVRWPKYWSFSFNISSSNEYSWLIAFRIDSFDLLAIQGTVKSLLQHHNSKASILWHSTFFIVQLSHPYITCLTDKYRPYITCLTDKYRMCSDCPTHWLFPYFSPSSQVSLFPEVQ